MKVGFVNIFGRPNAGKSTLLNTLIAEKLAIVSPKAQTTRHRIKAILNEPGYQVIFSDTPGIIEPKYKLHEKMMKAVKNALEDADLGLLLVDITDDWKVSNEIFTALRLSVPSLVVLNKTDLVQPRTISEATTFFSEKPYATEVMTLSARTGTGRQQLLDRVIAMLPDGEPFYSGEEISDLPTKFFVAELVREKVYELFQDEIPYHTAVTVREFTDKTTLTKIAADVVVQRESQKAIIIGEGGKMIKKLGTQSRVEIEKFLGRKVFLELFVKVKEKWREREDYLNEFGY
ncbi:MAG TPA: GTPase Era [Chitinophagaceae bacterium]|jgi:GTP-binding protein Era